MEITIHDTPGFFPGIPRENAFPVSKTQEDAHRVLALPETIEQQELRAIHMSPCYDHDSGSMESQLLPFLGEKWLKMKNGGNVQLVLHKEIWKLEENTSPEQWMQSATCFPEIPSLRIASMMEMCEMIRSGDPFLSDESRPVVYVSSSKKGQEYYAWFPDLYRWEPYGSCAWWSAFKGHALALRCLMDIPSSV